MPWKEKTVKELRKEFIESAANDVNISSLCREFGISRTTGYKWLKRSQEDGDLSDRSRMPKTIANKTPEYIEQLIIETRLKFNGWGAKKIRQHLENKGYTLPCDKTINSILKRNGCISKEESQKHTAFVRYEKSLCNEMWQTDFKGEFKMLDENYCFPLDILDDHSRFAIKIKASPNTINAVLPAFKEAFYEYGMPKSVLSDNGVQFAGFRQGCTQFEKWLMNHDVLPIHGRIKHPQTQGKIERFHRSMKEELLKFYTPRNIEDAERVLNEWRYLYNNERPHEALKMKCPSDIYVRSNREYIDTVEAYEYSGVYHVVKVNSWGYIRFNSFQIYLSETMINERIEMRPSEDEKTFLACYRNYIIAELDTETGKLINRRIRRI